MTFDNSGTRLITCEADKTIKVYKEDETATEESHPINWKPDILKRRKFWFIYTSIKNNLVFQKILNTRVESMYVFQLSLLPNSEFHF